MRHLTATAGRWTVLLLLFSISACTTPEQRATPSRNSPLGGTADATVESKTDTVEIKEMKFQPAVLTVPPGTTIVFINNDIVTHDITEQATKAWSSNLLPPSKSWSMVADKTVDYFCSIHVVMKGRIVVK